MQRYKSSLAFGPGAQLGFIAAIFFLSFLTFNILFQATTENGYFSEIIAALIGTILAAVVTTVLLRSQTQGEELKERNVEVFRKKVDAYQNFVDRSLELLDDSQLSPEEARELRRSVYKLSLFSSEETLATVSRFLRAQFVQDDECGLTEVVSAFRKELALERVDELAGIDMDVVDNLLAHGGDRSHFGDTKLALEQFLEKLLDELIALDAALIEGAELSDTMGAGRGLLQTLTLSSGVEFGFSLDYDHDDADLIESYLDLEGLAQKKAASVSKLALSLGFDQASSSVEDQLSGDAMPEALISASGKECGDDDASGRSVWSMEDFAKAVLEIESAARPSRKRPDKG